MRRLLREEYQAPHPCVMTRDKTSWWYLWTRTIVWHSYACEVGQVDRNILSYQGHPTCRQLETLNVSPVLSPWWDWFLGKSQSPSFIEASHELNIDTNTNEILTARYSEIRQKRRPQSRGYQIGLVLVWVQRQCRTQILYPLRHRFDNSLTNPNLLQRISKRRLTPRNHLAVNQ